MGKERVYFDEVNNELKRKSLREKALNSCYMNPDKIEDYLQEGTISPGDAREIRRTHVLDDNFTENRPLELDVALRRGDITYWEYCEYIKRFYLKADQPRGEVNGMLDFSEVSPENIDWNWTKEYEELFLLGGPPARKIKSERTGEFGKIDFRSPYPLSEMDDSEIERAASLFYLIEKRNSDSGGINKPLEFIEELNLNGFRLPNSLNKILLESRKHDCLDEHFKMSKLRFARFRNKVRSYVTSFWIKIFFHSPKIYENVWKTDKLKASIQ